MYLYQFEDGTLHTFPHPPTEGDKLAIDAGILIVYTMSHSGLFVFSESDGTKRVMDAVREIYEGETYTVQPDAG